MAVVEACFLLSKDCPLSLHDSLIGDCEVADPLMRDTAFGCLEDLIQWDIHFGVFGEVEIWTCLWKTVKGIADLMCLIVDMQRYFVDIVDSVDSASYS